MAFSGFDELGTRNHGYDVMTIDNHNASGTWLRGPESLAQIDLCALRTLIIQHAPVQAGTFSTMSGRAPNYPIARKDDTLGLTRLQSKSLGITNSMGRHEQNESALEMRHGRRDPRQVSA